jgi:hypothetical protein
VNLYLREIAVSLFVASWASCFADRVIDPNYHDEKMELDGVGFFVREPDPGQQNLGFSKAVDV